MKNLNKLELEAAVYQLIERHGISDVLEVVRQRAQQISQDGDQSRFHRPFHLAIHIGLARIIQEIEEESDLRDSRWTES